MLFPKYLIIQIPTFTPADALFLHSKNNHFFPAPFAAQNCGRAGILHSRPMPARDVITQPRKHTIPSPGLILKPNTPHKRPSTNKKVWVCFPAVFSHPKSGPQLQKQKQKSLTPQPTA